MSNISGSTVGGGGIVQDSAILTLDGDFDQGGNLYLARVGNIVHLYTIENISLSSIQDPITTSIIPDRFLPADNGTNTVRHVDNTTRGTVSNIFVAIVHIENTVNNLRGKFQYSSYNFSTGANQVNKVLPFSLTWGLLP